MNNARVARMLFVSILLLRELSLWEGTSCQGHTAVIWPRRTLPSSPRFFLETPRGRVWDLECCPGLEGAQTDMAHTFFKPLVPGLWIRSLFLQALAYTLQKL